MAAFGLILFAIPILIVLAGGMLFMLQRYGKDAVAGRQKIGRRFF